eukprot:6122181-Amphidinium_carterae.1
MEDANGEPPNPDQQPGGETISARICCTLKHLNREHPEEMPGSTDTLQGMLTGRTIRKNLVSRSPFKSKKAPSNQGAAPFNKGAAPLNPGEKFATFPSLPGGPFKFLALYSGQR